MLEYQKVVTHVTTLQEVLSLHCSAGPYIPSLRFSPQRDGINL